jgi:hypothetical protein
MRIRKLGDDLYRSLCEVYPNDTARKYAKDVIEKSCLDLIFTSLYYKEEFIDYFSRASNREIHNEIIDDFDFRFNSSRPRDKREAMERTV